VKAETKQEGKKRWYPCPKCGDQHPSITTILDVISSPALMGWMAKNGTAKLNILDQVCQEQFKHLDPNMDYPAMRRSAEERWKLKEDTAFWKSGKETGAEAADYGTMAHAWIEAHLHGKDVSLEALPMPAQNAVNEYLKWEKEHKLETIKTEETFYNCRLNYAGTCDWIGKLDGQLSLGDWKTSTGIFFNYIIQGWGYALADETQNAERLYGQMFIGRFGKDGSSEVRTFRRNDFPGIEVARDVLIACGHIFAALQTWDQKFPYQRKSKPTIKGDK
jgi:hypothetical protein